MTLRPIASCFLTLVLVLTLAACSPQDADSIAGTYAARGDTSIALTLNDNGKGTWSTDMDEISFKWSVREGGILWVHTREGGVIQGVARDGQVTLTLPGVGELVFERE